MNFGIPEILVLLGAIGVYYFIYKTIKSLFSK